MNSLNASVVETAAHCFYDDARQPIPASEIQFRPQYHHHTAPLGCWTGMQVVVAPQFVWASPGQPVSADQAVANDYAFLVVSPLKGHKLQSVVNGVQALSSTALSHTVTTYSYPGAPPYVLYSYQGQAITKKTQDGVSILQMTSDPTLQVGSSGGPWFLTYAGTPHLIGHTSGGNDNDTASPILDSRWSSLLSQAEKVSVT